MAVLRICLLLGVACWAKHVMVEDADSARDIKVEDADMTRDIMVENANSSFRLDGGKCANGTDGIALATIMFRYPSGWVTSWDKVIGAVHNVMEDFGSKAFHMQVIPQLDKPIVCKGKTWTLSKKNSARINIVTLRVCGATDADLFCQCTVNMPQGKSAKNVVANAKYHTCMKGITHADTVLKKLPFLNDKLTELARPKMEFELAKAAMMKGFFDGDSGQEIIAVEFVSPDEMDKWSTEEEACKSAKELIGSGEGPENTGKTDREQTWKKIRPDLEKEVAKEKDLPDEEKIKRQMIDENKPEFCTKPDAADLAKAARQALLGAFR